MSEECCIGEWQGCCCKCQWHEEDFEHCTTNPALRDENGTCICNIHKGWICQIPGDHSFSGWPEHGYCEMFKEKDEP